MMLRIVGAVLVVVSCAGFGFLLAMNYRAEERSLRNLMDALNYMECQLQFSMVSLPELAHSAAAGGVLDKIFKQFVYELETNNYPDPSACMNAVLEKQRIQPVTKSLLVSMGRSLGCFDLEGQVKTIKAVQDDCAQQLAKLIEDKEVRIRNYQTLGICAGAALAILLI